MQDSNPEDWGSTFISGSISDLDELLSNLWIKMKIESIDLCMGLSKSSCCKIKTCLIYVDTLPVSETDRIQLYPEP